MVEPIEMIESTGAAGVPGRCLRAGDDTALSLGGQPRLGVTVIVVAAKAAVFDRRSTTRRCVTAARVRRRRPAELVQVRGEVVERGMNMAMTF
jgi:hypothetical protein